MPADELSAGKTQGTVRVAAVQAEPAWLNVSAGVIKTVTLIAEAASKGAQIIAFPETWLIGYPVFLWGSGFGEYLELAHKYRAQSVALNSPEIATICAAAKAEKIWVQLGFSEKDNGSLYINSCWINPAGEIVSSRRKLKPTGVERVLFGEGSGDSLNSVITSPLGKIGSLQCWEHIQPLLRFHSFAQHEQIHIAAWPPLFPWKAGEFWGTSRDGLQAVSATYALEGSCFVIMCTQVCTQSGLESFLTPEEIDRCPVVGTVPGGGAAAVFNPDGSRLTEAMPEGEEGLLIADLDLSLIEKAKLLCDPVGHYSRSDLLALKVVNDERLGVLH